MSPMAINAACLARLLGCFLLLSAAVSQETFAQEAPTNAQSKNGALSLEQPGRGRRDDAAARIRRALLTKMEVKIDNEPLFKTISRLCREQQIQVVIDERKLAEEGIAREQVVSLEIQGKITLHSALQLIFGPLQLEYVIADDVLQVTTTVAASEIVSPRVFDVSDLLEAETDVDSIINTISSTISPWSWPEQTGPGPMRPINRCLVVPHSQRYLTEIEYFFCDLRRSLSREPRKLASPRDVLDDAERLLFEGLSQTVTVNVQNEPLEKILKDLSKTHSLPIWLDESKIADEEVVLDQLVTFALENVKLESILDNLLHPLKLEWLIEDEVLKITTQIAAGERLTTKVYELPKLPKKNVAAEPATAAVRWVNYQTFPDQPLDWGVGHDEELDSWIDLISSTISSDSWDEVGGSGSMRPLLGRLVIRQTQRIHRVIERLFADLRAVGPAALAPLPEPKPANRFSVHAYHVKDPERLAEIIPEMIAPESWKDAGGEGSIRATAEAIIVRQTGTVHRDIATLVWSLRAP